MQQAPPPPAVRGLGYAAAAWNLGFAGVSVWLVEGGVAKTAIGMFALVGLPYTLKFAWAPLIDRLRLLVGVFDHLARRPTHIAHRGSHAQCTALRFGPLPRLHTELEDVQFRLTHGAFEA